MGEFVGTYELSVLYECDDVDVASDAARQVTESMAEPPMMAMSAVRPRKAKTSPSALSARVSWCLLCI